MAGNKLGLRLRNGAVHLTANLVVYVGPLRIAKRFDTYGDGIYAYLDSGIGECHSRFTSITSWS